MNRPETQVPDGRRPQAAGARLVIIDLTGDSDGSDASPPPPRRAAAKIESDDSDASPSPPPRAAAAYFDLTLDDDGNNIVNPPQPPMIVNPEPAHVPRPPARARKAYNRGRGEELEYLCSGCNEELGYEFSEEEDERYDRGEGPPLPDMDRHLFAPIECGHVGSPYTYTVASDT
ncbi:hypothetical protein B0T26DRAFT_677924 [Lasiosphaeria miniovina]|uniref:Uncharacterized protein n=1 Tax=Lasiosphaeria miniovina TaxID=1954250 RepID=A0AA40AD36_9PEZI|nr:uncharacterized protein B0T26DRAFT_677924 [Lasiosphaeria miniovina]KAK0713612.1 hypothetical protein B0T26DRAFT_677924 [Lasiosphaeria miniovina]